MDLHNNNGAHDMQTNGLPGCKKPNQKKSRILLLLFAIAFALCWGLPKAIYNRDFGFAWLVFVACVCLAWLIIRPSAVRRIKQKKTHQ